MKNFALIGAAGYIAPRHMKAIKETGNNLVAAFDPYDGIGIMDSNFPQAYFFTEFERFDSFIDQWHRTQEKKIEYIAIASPNYLHESHIRSTLKNGAHAICEKPLVLNPKEIDQLQAIEQETGKKVYTILQLRLHDSIIALKNKIAKELEATPTKYMILILPTSQAEENGTLPLGRVMRANPAALPPISACTFLI